MKRLILPFLALFIFTACQHSKPTVSYEQFKLAEQMLPKHAVDLVYNDGVYPKWISDDSFWYRIKTRKGNEFYKVEIENKSKIHAFDHKRLAEALGLVFDTTFAAYDLPFTSIDLNLKDQRLSFNYNNQKFVCDLTDYSLIEKVSKAKPNFVSPDKKWKAYIKNHNLYVKNLNTNQLKKLTTDGEKSYEYATSLSWYEITNVESPEPKLVDTSIYWSPDSKKIATIRTDYRKAKNLYLWQSVPEKSDRAQVWGYERTLPGDEDLAMVEFVVFDLEKGTKKKVDLGQIPSFLYWGTLAWVDDNHLRLSYPERGYKKMNVLEVNAKNGKSRLVTTDEMDTYVDVNIFTYEFLEDTQELIMSSERDGWNHYYLFDWKSGKLVNQITKGEFVVNGINHIDKKNRKLYFQALGREQGRNPYSAHTYSVNFDGSELTLLTKEDAYHQVDFSTEGKYFVDNFSRVDLPTTSLVRSSETGEILMELEKADDGDLLALGYQYPEPFTVKARDGETDLWGVIFRPMNFDANKSYAVIDNSYSGPQAVNTPQTFYKGYRNWNNSFTALDFVIVSVDGLGTAQRSKTFHDFSYKNLGDIGNEDHIKAIAELCEKYDFMDVDRVGIYGHSAGGYDACRALLLRPDFYKVGVSSAGNHDHRLAKAWWPELYMGYPVGDNYADQSNLKLADNLQGKLLLVHGDMDNNVNPIETMQMANAFMEANKEFDLLIVPNETHYLYNHKFFTMKRWNYFIEHLMGAEAVWDYKLRENFEE